MVVLLKTANPEHMKANAELDFVIFPEDMELLGKMERIKDYGEYSNSPVIGRGHHFFLQSRFFLSALSKGLSSSFGSPSLSP